MTSSFAFGTFAFYFASMAPASASMAPVSLIAFASMAFDSLKPLPHANEWEVRKEQWPRNDSFFPPHNYQLEFLFRFLVLLSCEEDFHLS